MPVGFGTSAARGSVVGVLALLALLAAWDGYLLLRYTLRQRRYDSGKGGCDFKPPSQFLMIVLLVLGSVAILAPFVSLSYAFLPVIPGTILILCLFGSVSNWLGDNV